MGRKGAIAMRLRSFANSYTDPSESAQALKVGVIGHYVLLEG